MAYGIVAEFVGTVEEAKAFAKEHGLNHAMNKGTEPNGYPYISITSRHNSDLDKDLAKFKELGWDEDFLEINVYSGKLANRSIT
jgi:hypothetical protein